MRDVSDGNLTALLCLAQDCPQTHIGGGSRDKGWSIRIEDERAHTVSDSVLLIRKGAQFVGQVTWIILCNIHEVVRDCAYLHC
ncbi:hypothetical protein PoB_002344400 [Plakobranchus ocellatus]|uniref:Uncharacterized protein n=1 Tax=Plakobranchus ocellatus TaxID=259542 RepID=A0AAV3ZST1_9GAST|nr:hypothetical protein PoB_002344400 [Plakobranchus ocellatus]